MLFQQRFNIVSAQQRGQAGVVLVNKGAQSRGGREGPLRDRRLNAELFIEVFWLKCQRVNQVTHVQHFRWRARDGFGDVARVEVHQADAGIFHLRAADPVRRVVNVIWQIFIAARFEVRWVVRHAGDFLRRFGGYFRLRGVRLRRRGGSQNFSRVQGNCLRISCISAFAWVYRLSIFDFLWLSRFHLHIAGGFLFNK